MKRLSGPRKAASDLSAFALQPLDTFAIAAGVSPLLLVQPSKAKVAYTPAPFDNVYVNP